MNDHPEIARDLPLEGLHLGQDDLPIAAAREIVRRENCWIGKSTHSLAQAIAAGREGADYIGFGPLFATPTKPDYAPIGIDEIASRPRVGEDSDLLHRRNQAGKSPGGFSRWRKARRHRIGTAAGCRHRRRHAARRSSCSNPQSANPKSALAHVCSRCWFHRPRYRQNSRRRARRSARRLRFLRRARARAFSRRSISSAWSATIFPNRNLNSGNRTTSTRPACSG